MTEIKEIESAIRGFKRAYDAGNLDAVLAYYTDDLIKMRQGAEAETKKVTAQRVSSVFANFSSKVDVIVDEIIVEGNLAFTRGSFQVTLTPKAGGEKIVMERRYLEVWRKVNGEWLVARTMDNFV